MAGSAALIFLPRHKTASSAAALPRREGRRLGEPDIDPAPRYGCWPPRPLCGEGEILLSYTSRKKGEKEIADQKFFLKYFFMCVMLHTPPQEYSMTAEGGALVPREWCIHSGEMVHGGRRRGAPSRHAGAYSGRALRLRMDSPSIWIVYAL